MSPRSLRLALPGLALASAAAFAVLDDAGVEVSLASPPARIVTLAPHAAELVYELGAGARLVGTVSFSDFPPPARRLPRVGRNDNLDLERILALEPDLVVGWLSGNPPHQLARLRELGVPVFLTEPRRLADLPRLQRRLGELLGLAENGEARARAFEEGLAELGGAAAGRARGRVFYQVWYQPLMTVNGRHFISDALALCGGENVFADLEELVPRVTVEAVLLADPALIVTGHTEAEAERWLDAWRRWRGLRAVRDGQLHRVDPDLLQRPSARLLQGAERLCAILDRARAGAGVAPSR